MNAELPEVVNRLEKNILLSNTLQKNDGLDLATLIFSFLIFFVTSVLNW
jgi:hypothetical protein